MLLFYHPLHHSFNINKYINMATQLQMCLITEWDAGERKRQFSKILQLVQWCGATFKLLTPKSELWKFSDQTSTLGKARKCASRGATKRQWLPGILCFVGWLTRRAEECRKNDSAQMRMESDSARPAGTWSEAPLFPNTERLWQPAKRQALHKQRSYPRSRDCKQDLCCHASLVIGPFCLGDSRKGGGKARGFLGQPLAMPHLPDREVFKQLTQGGQTPPGLLSGHRWSHS